MTPLPRPAVAFGVRFHPAPAWVLSAVVDGDALCVTCDLPAIVAARKNATISRARWLLGGCVYGPYGRVEVTPGERVLRVYVRLAQ